MEFFFYLLLFLIFYTFLGYPLLIWGLSRLWPKPIQKKESFEDVTIVFSAFNEGAAIKTKIENCISLNYPENLVRIIVASDGSTDNTNILLDECSKKYANLTTLIFNKQRGKAACVNDLLAEVQTQYVVLTDVRQDFDRDALTEILANFSDPAVGAASGELQFKIDSSTPKSKGMDIYWHYEKFIRKCESKFSSSVGVTGAIYAIRTQLFQPIPENCILDDVLIPMNIVKQNYRVVFEEKAIAYDMPSTDMIREKKRKTRTIAGNYQLLQLSPWLLNPFVNCLFAQFISHKILRLFMPLCLVFLLILNVLLYNNHSIFKTLLFGQTFFYFLPIFARLSIMPSILKTLSKGITAFLHLNYFSALGFLEFLKNKNTHIWK